MILCNFGYLCLRNNVRNGIGNGFTLLGHVKMHGLSNALYSTHRDVFVSHMCKV